MAVYEIELNNIPNQIFTTTINDIDMEITLKLGGEENNQIMFFALATNNEYLCPFVPVFANQGILPYPYMISELGGNFIFITDDDEYPNYLNFGTTQNLYFITEDELNNG